MKYAMVVKINSIPPNGHQVGSYTWSDSNHLVFIFRRLNRLLIRTGFRLGEVVAHTSGEIMYLTRASVVWRINGVLYTHPSMALLHSMVPGRDGSLVVPPRAKPDQWGEVHCPFTIFLPLTASAEDACAALRDIEVHIPCTNREHTALFCDHRGLPYSHGVLDPILKAVITHLYGPAVAAIYSWHSYRSGLATMLYAAGVPDAVIMLMCRWMCEASLHVYRRLGNAQNESNFRKATTANVDSIQAANVPTVVNDQRYAALLSDLNNQRDRNAAIDAFAAAMRGDQPLPDVARAPAPPQPAGAPPPPPVRHPPPRPPPAPDLRPLNADNASGRRVLVPATRWPQYRCSEHGGHGWEATILNNTRSTAVVRFAFARTRDGRPYADERILLANLTPL